MYSLRRERSQLQREVACLQTALDEAKRNFEEAQTGRENVHAYCKVIEQERDGWKQAKGESDGVIRRIVALVPRDVEREDIVAAVKRTVQEVERLTERYVGNRADCGHLKCFTRAPGLIVEGCQVCESEDVRAQVKAVRELREEMIACPDCPQPACRVHYDRFGEVYVVIMEEMRW